MGRFVKGSVAMPRDDRSSITAVQRRGGTSVGVLMGPVVPDTSAVADVAGADGVAAEVTLPLHADSTSSPHSSRTVGLLTAPA